MITKNFQRIIFSFAIAILLMPMQSRATHMAGADLTYVHLGNNQYQFNYTFYRDCIGIPAQSSFTLQIRSVACNINTTITLLPLPGTGQEISYTCAGAVTTCRGGSAPGIQKWEYTGTYTLPAQCPDWTFGVSGCCRNAAITTIVNPDSYNLYIQATLSNMSTNNNSPFFSNVPIAFECINQNNFYNHGVIDVDGDSLVYSFVHPMDAQNVLLQYAGGYSTSNPISSVPVVSINPTTGDVFMHPVAPEVGVIAVIVQEYRNGVLIGSVIRDIQIYTIQCNNQLPLASGINGTNVFTANICAGTNLCFDIFSSDINTPDSVTMFWNNGIPAATFSSTGNYRPTGHFCWTPGLSDVRSQPYAFVVTVRDNACPSNGVQSFAYLIYVGELSHTLTSTPAVSCFGGHNGSASVSAIGNGPLQYLWMPGEFTGSSVSHLSAGNYSLTIIDSLGCTITRYFTINEPPPLQLTLSAQHVGCNGSLGSATAAVSGGTPGYTYTWNTIPVQTGPVAMDLSGGNYAVTVRDANNCRKTGNVLVEEVLPMSAGISSTPATCNAADGTASVQTSGGSGSFSYQWTPNVSNASAATGLISGVYEVLVSDDSTACSVALMTVVNNSSGIIASITASSDATCQGGEDGAALAQGTGGYAPYSYSWSPSGATTAAVNNLSPGLHTVAVSDYNGCTGFAQVQIGFINPSPVVDLGADTALCPGATLLLDAGSGPYTYLWSDNSTLQTLSVSSAGTYAVLVRDINGCEAFDAIQVSYVPCQRPFSIKSHDALHNFTISPNPTGSSVWLSYPGLAARDHIDLLLMDVLGSIHLTRELAASDNNQVQLDLSNLSPGIYYLHIRTSGRSEVLRLVKQ